MDVDDAAFRAERRDRMEPGSVCPWWCVRRVVFGPHEYRHAVCIQHIVVLRKQGEVRCRDFEIVDVCCVSQAKVVGRDRSA